MALIAHVSFWDSLRRLSKSVVACRRCNGISRWGQHTGFRTQSYNEGWLLAMNWILLWGVVSGCPCNVCLLELWHWFVSAADRLSAVCRSSTTFLVSSRVWPLIRLRSRQTGITSSVLRQQLRRVSLTKYWHIESRPCTSWNPLGGYVQQLIIESVSSNERCKNRLKGEVSILRPSQVLHRSLDGIGTLLQGYINNGWLGCRRSISR